LIASAVAALGVTATHATTYVRSARAPSTATCASTGDASPGTLVLTPTTSAVHVTQADPDGCSLTLSEFGAAAGQQLRVVLVSNAGGTLDAADLSTVQETGSGCSMSQWGAATFEYITDRWVLASCVASN